MYVMSSRSLDDHINALILMENLLDRYFMIKNFKQYLVGRLARIMCALLDRQDIQEKLKSLFNQILIDDKSQKILAESIGKRCLQEQL
jgi:hypothetical protein